jgi:hypothetical protein
MGVDDHLGRTARRDRHVRVSIEGVPDRHRRTRSEARPVDRERLRRGRACYRIWRNVADCRCHGSGHHAEGEGRRVAASGILGLHSPGVAGTSGLIVIRRCVESNKVASVRTGAAVMPLLYDRSQTIWPQTCLTLGRIAESRARSQGGQYWPKYFLRRSSTPPLHFVTAPARAMSVGNRQTVFRRTIASFGASGALPHCQYKLLRREPKPPWHA